MPTYTGVLNVRAKSTDFDNNSFEDDFEFKANPEIFDLSLDRNLKKHGNAHNLPVDPVSIAIAASMGINWKEVVGSCSTGDDSVEYTFDQQDSGPHSIKLPTTHPLLNGAVGDAASLIRCSDQFAKIIIDKEIEWRCKRDWPEEGGSYIDTGALYVPRDLIPLSALAAFQANVDAGSLTLDQIVMVENAEIPSATVKSIAMAMTDTKVIFHCEFPANGKGCSSLS